MLKHNAGGVRLPIKKVVLILLLSFSYLLVASEVTAAVEEAIDNSAFYGPIKNADDLWQIAIAYRPNDTVSIEKTAVAIYQLNPRAFLKQNINGVMSGYFLQIPTLEQIKMVSEQEALNVIQDQNKRWQQINTPEPEKLEAKTDNDYSKKIVEVSEPATDFSQPPETSMEEYQGSDNSAPEMLLADNQFSNTEGLLAEKKEDQMFISNNKDDVNTVRAEEFSADQANFDNNVEATNAKLLTQVAELQQQNKKLNSVVKQQEDVAIEKAQSVNSKAHTSSSFGQSLDSEERLNQSVVKSIQKYQHWVIVAALFIVISIIIIIRRKLARRRMKRNDDKPSQLSSEALKEFSGDNIYDTQLDLATAYIALRRFDEAVLLLESVIETGDPEQVTYAQSLIEAIEQKKTEK